MKADRRCILKVESERVCIAVQQAGGIFARGRQGEQ